MRGRLKDRERLLNWGQYRLEKNRCYIVLRVWFRGSNASGGWRHEECRLVLRTHARRGWSDRRLDCITLLKGLVEAVYV